MNKTAIRPMTIPDYAAVLALWQVSEGVGLSSSDSPDSIARYLQHNPGLSFVAEEDGQFVGAALSGHDGRRGYIHHLAVHPTHRRRGIGRELVKRCLSALASEGIEKCHLFVFARNEAAVNFWQETGWTRRSDLLALSHYTENDPTYQT